MTRALISVAKRRHRWMRRETSISWAWHSRIESAPQDATPRLTHPPTPSDRAPQASLRPGSEADFARLYTGSWGRVVASLLALTGSREDAEDCAQEAFERAYRAWDRWSPDAPAEAWLHRIAINVGIDHRRRERLRRLGQALRDLAPPPAPDGPGQPRRPGRPGRSTPAPAAQAGRRDRSAPSSWVHQPGDRSGPGGAGAHGCQPARRGQDAAPERPGPPVAARNGYSGGPRRCDG